MKETIEFVKDTFNTGIDRLKFPLFNSIVISWMIFNWKPIFIILFSNESMEYRISFVTESYSNIWYNYVIPLGVGVFYTFVTPYIKKCVNRILYKVNNDNRNSKYQFRIDSYSKKGQLATARYDYSLKKTGLDNVIDLTKRIGTLTTDIHKVRHDLRKAEEVIEQKNRENEVLTQRKNELEKGYEVVDNIVHSYHTAFHRNSVTLHKYLAFVPQTEETVGALDFANEVSLSYKQPYGQYQLLKENLNIPYPESNTP